MTRLFVVAFLGKPRSEGASHAHEVPPVMWAPLVALAVAAIVAGFKVVAGQVLPPDSSPCSSRNTTPTATPWCSGFPSPRSSSGPAWDSSSTAGASTDPLNITLFRRKFFFDEIYNGFIKAVQDGGAAVLNLIDRHLIDGLLVGGAGHMASGLGAAFRRLQSGNLQSYTFIIGLGLLLFWWIAASF